MSNKRIPDFQFYKKNEIDSDLTFLLKTEFSKNRRSIYGESLTVLTNNGKETLDIQRFGFHEFKSFWNTAELHLVCMKKNKIVAIEQGGKFLLVKGNQIQLWTKRESYMRATNTPSFKAVCELDPIKLAPEKPNVPKIVIRNRLDPVTELYAPNGKLVGRIRNRAAFDDIRAQIAENEAEGFYVMYNGIKIPLSKHGGYTVSPDGFYDSSDKSIDKIMKL